MSGTSIGDYSAYKCAKGSVIYQKGNIVNEKTTINKQFNQASFQVSAGPGNLSIWFASKLVGQFQSMTHRFKGVVFQV